MEIKLQCGCGQRYAFDVVPVNGAMPVAVNCPKCGIDGTLSANAFITSALSIGTAAPPAPAPVVSAPPPVAPVKVGLKVGSSSHAAAPVTAPPQPAPPPPAPTAAPTPAAKTGLKVGRSAHASTPATAGHATPPPLPPTAQAAAPAKAAAVANVPAAKPKGGFPEFSWPLGITGALIGAGIGVGLMYAFYLFAEFKMPMLGTIIGVLTGVGARVMFRGTDSMLGIIAGGIALVAVGTTFYLMFGGISVFSIVSLVVSVSVANRIAS